MVRLDLRGGGRGPHRCSWVASSDRRIRTLVAAAGWDHSLDTIGRRCTASLIATPRQFRVSDDPNCFAETETPPTRPILRFLNRRASERFRREDRHRVRHLLSLIVARALSWLARSLPVHARVAPCRLAGVSHLPRFRNLSRQRGGQPRPGRGPRRWWADRRSGDSPGLQGSIEKLGRPAHGAGQVAPGDDTRCSHRRGRLARLGRGPRPWSRRRHHHRPCGRLRLHRTSASRARLRPDSRHPRTTSRIMFDGVVPPAGDRTACKSWRRPLRACAPRFRRSDVASAQCSSPIATSSRTVIGDVVRTRDHVAAGCRPHRPRLPSPDRARLLASRRLDPQRTIRPAFDVPRTDDIDADLDVGLSWIVGELERAITTAPDQWVMFQGVWPSAPVDPVRVFPLGSPLSGEFANGSARRCPVAGRHRQRIDRPEVVGSRIGDDHANQRADGVLSRHEHQTVDLWSVTPGSTDA